MMNLDREEQLLQKRFSELANTAFYRGICLFTDYLNLNGQNLFFRMRDELPKIKYFAYGGFQDAERKILCFCGDNRISEQQEIAFPIACIRVEPVNEKFSDSLNHRDFLGAVLNLGPRRDKVGDILIDGNKGYIFAHTSISAYLADSLTRVKHTNVSTSIIDQRDFSYKPKLTEIAGTVASVRLDSILSVAFHASRSSLAGLIEGGKVFVGGRQVLSGSYALKENDVVSVRGMGKFVYAGTSYQTKKGRYSVKILLYS